VALMVPFSSPYLQESLLYPRYILWMPNKKIKPTDTFLFPFSNCHSRKTIESAVNGKRPTRLTVADNSDNGNTRRPKTRKERRKRERERESERERGGKKRMKEREICVCVCVCARVCVYVYIYIYIYI